MRLWQSTHTELLCWGQREEFWFCHIQAVVTKCVWRNATSDYETEMRRMEILQEIKQMERRNIWRFFFLAKITHIHNVSITPVPALKIMRIGPRENIAVIITEWLKNRYLRRKQDGNSRASHHDLMANWVIKVPLLAETMLQKWKKAPRESRAGQEGATAKGWVQEAGFCCFTKPTWFSLQMEVVKEGNPTSHSFPNKPTLI